MAEHPRVMVGGPMDGAVWQGEHEPGGTCITYRANDGNVVLHYHADGGDPDAHSHHLCVVEADRLVLLACGHDPDDPGSWEIIGDHDDALAEAHRRAVDRDLNGRDQ